MFFKLEKEEQDQRLVDWYRYATFLNPKGGHGQHWYLIPFDASADADGTPHMLTEAESNILWKNKICIDCLATMLRFGQERWTSVRKAARSTGVAPKNKNKGRVRAFQWDDPIMAGVKKTFAEMELLSEPRATLEVATWDADGRFNRETSTATANSKDCWLPPSMGQRQCFARYMAKRGFERTELGKRKFVF